MFLTVPVLQHPLSHDYFLTQRETLYIQDQNEHFYPMPAKNVTRYQQATLHSLTFTEQGLNNLKLKYDEIYGVPAFIHSILNLDPSKDDIQNMLKYPEFFKYFKEERFLMIPNISYDPQCEYAAHPKVQKIKNRGITLCAWFIHPALSCLHAETHQVLEVLAEDNSYDKRSIIENLIKQSENKRGHKRLDGVENQRDTRKIGELRRDGDYLSSILDLDRSHLPLLQRLKEKIACHLRDQYQVDSNDSVAFYFHFPYDEQAVTLHMHVRVNHGSHPLERSRSFTVDEILWALSQGKTMNELILNKQQQSQGRFYKFDPEHEKICEHLPGITLQRAYPNIFRLEKEKSHRLRIDSRQEALGRAALRPHPEASVTSLYSPASPLSRNELEGLSKQMSQPFSPERYA